MLLTVTNELFVFAGISHLIVMQLQSFMTSKDMLNYPKTQLQTFLKLVQWTPFPYITHDQD